MYNFNQQRGRNHGWKVEGDQGLGHNTGTLAPRARPRPGWVLGAGGDRPSRCEGPGVLPPEIFENLDAKSSCILVTTCCDISCF